LGQPLWPAAFATIYLVCLIFPHSLTFVWVEKHQSKQYGWHAVVRRWHRKVLLLFYGVISLLRRLDNRSATELEAADRRFRIWLTVALIVSVLILMPLDASLYDLHKNSDGVVVTVLWRVVSVLYAFARLGAIGMIILMGYRYFARRNDGSESMPTRMESAQLSAGQVSLGGHISGPSDPRVYTDEERPEGWYVDPSNPETMHYWGAGDSDDWMGTVRTPRKIRRAWRASRQ
jgi:hypothetical protein